MNDAEFSQHLSGLLHTYPELRTEIEQSVVRDYRKEFVVRQMIERSEMEQDEIDQQLNEDATGWCEL